MSRASGSSDVHFRFQISDSRFQISDFGCPQSHTKQTVHPTHMLSVNPSFLNLLEGTQMRVSEERFVHSSSPFRFQVSVALLFLSPLISDMDCHFRFQTQLQISG